MGKITTRSQAQGRTILKNVIPLDTPYVLGIYTGDICNFRCKYCIHGIPGGNKEVCDCDDNPIDYGLVSSFLTWEDFLTISRQIKEFPSKIKKIMFSSIGEPLLNPRLPQMIKYLSQQRIAGGYETVTNASRLTHELSLALIGAGLSRLCVSIQGINAKSYKNICDYNIDFDALVDNLRFFYQHSRGKCQLHIKTVNIALSDGEEKKFFSLFQDICDTIHIDNVVPAFMGVDYSNMINNSNQGIYQENPYAVSVCPQVFYTLYVTPDGTIVPCCDAPYPTNYGNINKISLKNAWQGEKRRNFLKLHLNKLAKRYPICKECNSLNDVTYCEDILDDAATEILTRI